MSLHAEPFFLTASNLGKKKKNLIWTTALPLSLLPLGISPCCAVSLCFVSGTGGHYQYWLITAAAAGACPPARPGRHGSGSLFGMQPFRLPCFVLKNLFFGTVCTISPVLSPDVWWCPHVALAVLWLWLWPAFICGSFQCKLWTWLHRRLVARCWGKMGRTALLFCSYLQTKSLPSLWCLRTPREWLPCQRSARGEEFRTFVLLLPGRPLGYLLEEWQPVLWSVQNANSFHICLPLDFAQHGKTAEIFFVCSLFLPCLLWSHWRRRCCWAGARCAM